MEHKKLALGFLIILLIAGVVGLFAIAPVVNGARGSGSSNSSGPARAASLYGQVPVGSSLSGVAQARDPGVQELTLALPGWQQVNNNGFDIPGTLEVSALQAFNGNLYAGTHNPLDPEPLYDGAGIFRSPDGVNWTSVILPGFGAAHDAAPPAILDLALFNGKLYAGTGRGNAAKIYRTVDGLNWAPVVNSGFGDPDTRHINDLVEYNSYLYAGVTNEVSGAQIWRSFSGDSNSWSQVAPEVAGSAPAGVTAMASFSNTLFAAVEFEADAPLQIWASATGSNWTTIISDGFGDADNTMTGGMAVFSDTLYLGVGNLTSGAHLWRTNNGTSWEQAITPAFVDANNQKIEMVFVFQNHLYVSTRNSASGIEIWRSADGSVWEQANLDGFSDIDNTGSNGSNATAEFLGQLYLGTGNVLDGGELWRMDQPYDLNLSPDESQAAAAGQSITYSLWITNTGAMTDTFNLAAAGNSWTTVVSTSTITLTPGASDLFSVTVAIPSSALGNETDTVTLTATSQGDVTKSDTVLLTTSVLPIFGLDLSPGDTAAGLPGTTVTYTLTISNSGNTTDTYNLAVTGQTWTTTLSTAGITVSSGLSATFTANVTVPTGAWGTQADVVTITATSEANNAISDSATLTTTVITVYGVKLSADDNLSAPAGATVTYTLLVTNTGNLTDTFDLLKSGDVWTTTLSTGVVTLPAGQSQAVTIRVTIPAGAAALDSDGVTITAVSRGDGAKSDAAILTTTAGGQPDKVYLPLILKG